ncbi:hypothetical protein [Pseudarthrobacter sp. NS4]|uniref:hypothetical protein n=1 Tax=Pseudarthrobacter sp. NS4 TaxID=2973976 RepID=UPI002161FC96|nr:hypothetical protein [Pseudarthrobacter sp. NS4]
MTYLVCPERPIRWIDLAAVVCFEAVEMGLDLAGLSWLPSTRRWDGNTLPLALAHGTTCSTGIIVPAEVYVSVDRARKLQDFYLQLRQATTAEGRVAVDIRSTQRAAIEARGEREIRREWADALSKARTEADMLIAQKPRPELLHHWNRLTNSQERSGPHMRRSE